MTPRLRDVHALFPVEPAQVTPGQREGWFCVACDRDLLTAGDPGAPVRDGLYVCTPCIAAYERGRADA